MDLESFEDFSYNNYRLENYLRKIDLQNKNKENITKKLMKEKDPKKIVQMLLYRGGGLPGVPPKNQISRAQKYGIDLNIEDKLIKQGEIMKKRKQDLTDKYNKEFLEKNPYAPNIPNYNSEILGNKYPGEFLKRMEFFQLFKEKNLEKLKNDTKYNENKKNEKIEKTDNSNNTEKSALKHNEKKNYDYYIKNAFDRLHNEQIQIEQNQRRKSQLDNMNYNYYKDLLLNDKNKKNNDKNDDNGMNMNTIKKRLTLKELLMNDKIKKNYRYSVGDIINKNEIWPKKLKSNYLSNDNNKIDEDEEKQSYDSKNQKSKNDK